MDDERPRTPQDLGAPEYTEHELLENRIARIKAQQQQWMKKVLDLKSVPASALPEHERQALRAEYMQHFVDLDAEARDAAERLDRMEKPGPNR